MGDILLSQTICFRDQRILWERAHVYVGKHVQFIILFTIRKKTQHIYVSKWFLWFYLVIQKHGTSSEWNWLSMVELPMLLLTHHHQEWNFIEHCQLHVAVQSFAKSANFTRPNFLRLHIAATPLDPQNTSGTVTYPNEPTPHAHAMPDAHPDSTKHGWRWLKRVSQTLQMAYRPASAAKAFHLHPLVQ